MPGTESEIEWQTIAMWHGQPVKCRLVCRNFCVRLFLNECHRARTTRVLPAQRGVTAVQGEGMLNLHKIDVHFDAQHIWQK